MKKLFTYLLVAITMIIAGCSESFDDSEIWDKLNEHESRIAKLEELCKQMNTNISSLQTIVKALQNNDYVTGVTPITENGKTIGYTITFAKARSITIYHGKDGYTPVIGVKQDTDGIYYWTLDGEWLLDDAGNKIKAQGVDGKDGITPQLKIENDYWYVSYDNGASWTQLGKATGEDGKDGDSFFQSLTQDENCVYFTLADGTVITIPKGLALSIEFAESDLVVMSPNSTREIGYTVTSSLSGVKVEAIGSGDIKAKAVASSELSGVIKVTTGATIDEYSKVVVLVSNGEKVIMKTLKFEQEEIKVFDETNISVSEKGGEVELLYLSNVECEVIIPDSVDWISVAPATKALEQRSIKLILEENKGAARETVVILQNKNASLKLEYTILQEKTTNITYLLELERKSLIAIYNALDGDNWTNNENWCSDKPVSDWYGITTYDNGCVASIDLLSNNLSGRIPTEFGNLALIKKLSLSSNRLIGILPDNLKYLERLESLAVSDNSLSGPIDIITKFTNIKILYLGGNQFSGKIPNRINNLKLLKALDLSKNNLTGSIPNEICDLSNIERINLGDNYLTGTIPENIKNLPNLKELILHNNLLSGSIPKSFYTWDLWKSWWGWSLFLNNYDFKDLSLPGANAVIECFDGKIIDLEEEYKKHKYTILFGWSETTGYTYFILDQLKEIYNLYSENDIKIIGWSHFISMTKNQALDFIERENIKWNNFHYDRTNGHNHFKDVTQYPSSRTPSITVIDSTGKIVFSDIFDNRTFEVENYFISLLENDFNNVVTEKYTSKDYSKDGEVIILQEASIGNGIDIVMLGDAYSDRQIDDGTYHEDMESMYNNLFTEEPYKSFKDNFNVYYVNVVSKNEGYGAYNETALSSYFGNGTLVGGNDNAVFNYALKAISAEDMDEALLIVSMNSDNDAGTCWMYTPSGYSDYGHGVSVSYFSRGGDAETFAQLLHHEACGHGFAKLADEYAYEGTEIPSDDVSQIIQEQNDWGWWKNVDFTSDPTATRWSHFVNDTRYANEGLGAYEGGLTYWRGVWRPTENSIMRYNTGGFNAPSREAIYYRIHKLAYGDEWEYDYEEFVEWDARNRTTAATRAMVYKPANHKPTHPPVIVNKSWKDAK